MKRKNFPYRKRQRRIGALERLERWIKRPFMQMPQQAKRLCMFKEQIATLKQRIK